MIDISESELIEFFETLPLEQTQEEKEFFGSICFKIESDSSTLIFDVSKNFCDLFVEWKKCAVPDNKISIEMKQLISLEIVKDKPNSVPFLRAKSFNNCSILIWNKPKISIKVRNTE